MLFFSILAVFFIYITCDGDQDDTKLFYNYFDKKYTYVIYF